LVIDGTLAIEAIHDQIIQKVSHLLS
jgi:hypothetical protein